MLDSIYHMTLELLKFAFFGMKTFLARKTECLCRYIYYLYIDGMPLKQNKADKH